MEGTPGPGAAPERPRTTPDRDVAAEFGGYDASTRREDGARAAGATRMSLPDLRRTTSTWMRIVTVPAVKEHGALARYGMALGLTSLALALSLMLAPYLERSHFLFFWPAVIGAAWLGGLGPAILVSIYAVAAIDYFLIPPYHSLRPTDADDLVPLAIFLFASVVVSSLTQAMRTARHRATEAARDNAEAATQLETQSVELEQQLEEAQMLQEELEVATEELAERTAAAEAAEHFSRGILESISDPFVVHDREWRFRFINERAAEVFQQTRPSASGELIGKVVWEMYPALAGTAFEREMRRAVDERVPVTFEAFYAERGTWSVMTCYPLPDGGLATQWQDITDRKRAEEAAHYLSRATELLASSLDYEATLGELARLVVPQLADWCSVVIREPDGALRQVAVGHVDPEKVRWARELDRRYPPDPDAPSGVPKVVRTGKPELYHEITDAMLVEGAADAEHLRISRRLGLTSAMIVPLTAHDRTLGALCLFSAESGRRYTDADLALAAELARRAALAVDNARLHRAELDAHRAVEAAEAQLARVFAQAPVAIAVVRGPEHVYQIANDSYLAVIGRTDIIGKPMREARAGAERGGMAELLDQVYATGAPYVGNEREAWLPRGPDGALEASYFNFVLQPLTDAAGVVEGIAMVSTDVTALVRARRAADEANLAKTQFLAVMSHELRTPLNAIAGYAELLRMGIRGPTTSEQQEDLGRIVRSQRNLLSLINDVLNYAKLDAGHVEFATAPVVMSDMLSELEPLVRPQLHARSIVYDCPGCDTDLVASADGEKTRQILLNLLSNAIKFTEPGGRITVTCTGDDATVCVRVTDTGLGIPSEKLRAIFEPFVQLDRKLTTAHEGTGLGLSISRDLARAMGGELTVESTVGQGSTFSLLLPRAASAAAHDADVTP